MDLAVGEYFMFMDSYVLLVKHCFEKRITQMPNIDVLISSSAEFAGNINWFLKNNKKVVMHQDSTLYKFYKRKGFNVSPLNTIDINFTKNETPSNLDNNSKLMKAEFGEDRMKEKYVSILSV